MHLSDIAVAQRITEQTQSFTKKRYYNVKSADWNNSNELKQQYRNASIIGEGRAIFNIKGNTYRLVVLIDYEFKVIFIRFIGTHKQYDEIDSKTI